MSGVVACFICHWFAGSGLAHLPAALQGEAALLHPSAAPRGERTPERVSPADSPPHRVDRRVAIADAIVLDVMEASRATLFACVRRARDRDPLAVPRSIELRLEIDADGTVTAAAADLEDPKLQRCLVGVARRLRFPSPGEPAMASLAFVAP